MDNLKVLDRGLRDTTREIEDIRGGVIIPNRSFVVELDQVVHLSVLVAHKQTVIFLKEKMFYFSFKCTTQQLSVLLFVSERDSIFQHFICLGLFSSHITIYQ